VTDFRAYARAAAEAVGLNPDIFERQIQQESDFDPDAESPAGAVGIAQIMPSLHPNVDPHDPEASLDYAAQWMADLLRQFGGRYDLALAAYNAGPGNVAEFNGVPPFAETRAYLNAILGTDWQQAATLTAASVTAIGQRFDADLPTEFQRLPWTCSVRSATWCLKSVGVDITAEALHDILVPDVVNQDVGLCDGSGAGLARVMQQRFGVAARNKPVVSWDEVIRLAGTRPLAIGGRSWGPGGHWTAVRRANDDGTLALANPVRGGYRGVDTSMSATDFANFGPFAAVWINLADPPPADEWQDFKVTETSGAVLNVREQPTTGAPILTTLAPDTVVTGEPHAWRRVRTGDGSVGWVASEFLTSS
jgi:Transglycosylase SLT domain/Bacterial SH3 domain